ISENRWQPTMWHEIEHMLFTRSFPGLTPAAGDPVEPVYQDIEDMRKSLAFKNLFHGAVSNDPAVIDDGLRAAAQTADAGLFLHWLSSLGQHNTPRQIFQFALQCLGRGAVEATQVRALARVLDRNYGLALQSAAKYTAEMQIIARCLPRSLDEE